MHPNIPITIMIALACAFWGYHIAGKRGRSQVIAVVVCFIFGLIGVGVYALVTRKPKATPASMTELAPIP